MKLIIAGSRGIRPTPEEIRIWVGQNWFDYLRELEIVSGTAQGVDKCGEAFANQYKFKLHKFPANWKLHGKSAGPRRNMQMGVFADALLLIWDGKSRGSANMKAVMTRLNKPIYEVILE